MSRYPSGIPSTSARSPLQLPAIHQRRRLEPSKYLQRRRGGGIQTVPQSLFWRVNLRPSTTGTTLSKRGPFREIPGASTPKTQVPVTT